MSKLVWDETGKHFFEAGVEMGVLYIPTDGAYSKGVVWNGLSKVSEKPSGAEPSPVYADNNQYLNLMSAEKFTATLEAYTYPDEFAICDGSAELSKGVTIGQQTRKQFGLCYRTKVGNDIDQELGYKLHLIYGAQAAPSEKGYTTIGDKVDALTMSWEMSTTPVKVKGFKPTASLTIDSTKADPTKLAALEVILYGKDPTTAQGTDGVEPRLPLPDEIATMMAAG